MTGGQSLSLSLYRSDYINDTHSEYVYFINWHLLPSSSEGSPLMQFTRKETILLSHDTLPQAIKVSTLINNKIFTNNHLTIDPR